MKEESKLYNSRLTHGFSWLLVGNLGYAATQYLILIGLVKLTNPESVGLFSFALAINAPIYLLLSLGLRTVLVHDSKKAHSFLHYWGLRSRTAMASILVVFIFTTIANFSSDTIKITLIISLVKALESCIDIGYGLWQRHDKNNQIAFSMLIRGVFSSVIFNLILWKTNRLDFSCIGLVLSTALTGIFYDLPRWKPFIEEKFKLKIQLQISDWLTYKGLFLTSFPLGIAAVLSSVESNLPRYFIEHTINIKSLGLFSALSYPLMLGNQVVGALAAAPAPRLSDLTTNNKYKEFRQLLFKLICVGGIIGFTSYLICQLFGAQILTLINNAEYAKEERTFVLLAAASAVNYVTVFLGAGISALRRFQAKMVLQVLSFGVTFLALLFVVKQASLVQFGLALFISAIISGLFQLLTFLYYEQKWRKGLSL